MALSFSHRAPRGGAAVVEAAIERFIEVPGGGKVYVKQWRNLTKRSPIILLHDSLGCVATWKEFPSRLAERLDRPVIAYDRLGFGRSSERIGLPSTRFVHEEAEVILPAIIKTLGIDTFSLFGHSVGGGMAVIGGSLFGRQCEAVITESAQAFVEDRTLEGIRQAQKDFENPSAFGKLQKYHGEKTKWVLDAWIKTWLSPEFAKWSLRDDLPKVTCPILAIHGDRDEFGTVQFPQTIAELAGGKVAQKQIIAECGHVPHREKEEVVLDIIAKFYQSFVDKEPSSRL